MKIKGVLDAGHGGKSNWNIGYSGKYAEHNGMLLLCKLIKQKIEATGAFDIRLTRETDIFLELWERAQVAADFKADFFISEHTNAGDVSVRGSECFYSVDLPWDKEFASKISLDIANAFKVPNRGAKTNTVSGPWDGVNNVEDGFGVIDCAQDKKITHVWLVENLFHSNPDDEKLLLTQMDLIAEITAKNICLKFGVQYPLEMEGEEGMKIIVPFGIADTGAAQILASNIKGAVQDWGKVESQDDVIQVGGPLNAQPQVPCKSFKVITGSSRLETAEAVCKFVRGI